MRDEARKAFGDTDRFLAAYDGYWEEDGPTYRESLKGVMAVSYTPQNIVDYVLRVYDRLENYRRYVSHKKYEAEYGSIPTYTTRTHFQAQSKVLQKIYTEKYGV